MKMNGAGIAEVSEKSFEYIRLYNQSVPVCSILSAGKIQMSVQAVHLHFFLSSIPHSIDAVSEM